MDMNIEAVKRAHTYGGLERSTDTSRLIMQ